MLCTFAIGLERIKAFYDHIYLFKLLLLFFRLDIRTEEYLSMNKLMKLLTVFSNKIHRVGRFYKYCILSLITIIISIFSMLDAKRSHLDWN